MQKTEKYENTVIFYTRFSLISTFFLGLGKLLLGILGSQLLIISAIFSFVILFIRIYAFKHVFLNEKTTKKDSMIIGLTLCVGAIIYGIYNYMIIDEEVNYDMYLGILIALVSFIEVGISLAGIFRTSRSDHMFKNLKLVSFSLALTSLVLTATAIISFAGSSNEMLFFEDYFGIVISLIILLIGIYILFSYRIGSDESKIYSYIGTITGEVKLTKSYFYREYYFEYESYNNYISGKIKKRKPRLFSCPIYLKIIYIIFSEILIFPYFVGLIIYLFINIDLDKKLDRLLKEKGLEKNHLSDLTYDRIVLFDKSEFSDYNFDFLVEVMPPKVKEKYLTISNQDYYSSSIIGYLLLVVLIKEYYGFYYFPEYDVTLKPYDENLGLFFNISHSKNKIAVAISKEDIGIDIEYIRHISDSLKKKCFKTKKMTDKKATKCWTRFEAAGKLEGTGILKALDLKLSNYDIKTISYNDFYLSVAKYKKRIKFSDFIHFKHPRREK